MRFISALIFMTLLSANAYANSFNNSEISEWKSKATPVTENQAKIYYNTCNNHRDDRMEVTTQGTFCKCMSFGYKKNITQEDLHSLSKGNPEEKRAVMNKMLLKLYAPCMEFPVRDMVFNKCTKDAYQAGKKICACMANNMSSYISKRADSELETILRDNPNVYDPLHAITTSKSYEEKEKRTILQCIQENFKK